MSGPLDVPLFRRMLAGFGVSTLGNQANVVAGTWVMLEIADSAFLAATMVSSVFVTKFLLAVPAGIVADRMNRRTLMVATQALAGTCAAVLAVVTVADGSSAALLLTLTYLANACNAAADPSFSSMISDVLPDHLVPRGMALFSGTLNVGRVLGPAAGGAMIAGGAPEAAFAFNAASFLVYAIILAVMPAAPFAVARPEESLLASLRAGVAFVFGDPPFRTMMRTVGLVGFTGGAVHAMLPLVADRTLGLGADGYGMLVTAFGLAGFGAAMSRRLIDDRVPLRRSVPGGMVLMAAATVGLALARSPLMAAVASGLVGFGWVTAMAGVFGVALIAPPRHMRGRAMSAMTMLFAGISGTAALTAGRLVDAAGTTTILLSVALATVLGILSSRRLPEPTRPDPRTGRPEAAEAIRPA